MKGTRADLNPRESAPIRILIMSLLKRLTVRDIFSAGRRNNPGRRFFQPNDGRAWRARMARGCRLNAYTNDTSSFRQPPLVRIGRPEFFPRIAGLLSGGAMSGDDGVSVGIVLPVYNEAVILDRALDHLARIAESCPVVVVDGGSIDDSTAIARRLFRTEVCTEPN